MPTLIVHGRPDRVAPVALAEQMQARIPHSRLVLVDGGHPFPLMRRREQFITEVAAFLTASTSQPR
ncbi:MAG TPA: alpha/beta hydrolase [Streptosporangiaceae bacterium]|nr:alpha/beta hydrolase [Streptosporangiaceae bacterium]